MMKHFLISLLIFVSATSYAQENLLKDSSFEEQQVFSENEISRIAAFSDFDSNVQTANPKVDSPSKIINGVWYKKSANSGYLRAAVIDTDSQEGSKSLLLTIRQNTPQKGLDKWYGNVLTQYVKIKRGKTYTVKFYAKANIDCDRVYAGMVSESGEAVRGSKWINITSDWQEYEVQVSPSNNQSAVVIGIATIYNNEGKTNQTSVMIDNVRLYEK